MVGARTLGALVACCVLAGAAHADRDRVARRATDRVPVDETLRPANELERGRPWSPLAPLVPFGPFPKTPIERPQPTVPVRMPTPAPRPLPRAPAPVPVSAAETKREAPVGRIGGVVNGPVAPLFTLPDEVVLQAMTAGQVGFLACWHRALRSEAPPAVGKIKLHLELDAAGKVLSSWSDTDAPAFARCLGVIARGIAFPAPGRPAVVDLPLMFR